MNYYSQSFLAQISRLTKQLERSQITENLRQSEKWIRKPQETQKLSID